MDSKLMVTSTCQQESAPSVLKIFMSMLLNGIGFKDNDFIDSQAVLTVSQTILFNYNTKFKCDQLCEKGSYSLSNYIYLTIHNLTCEYMKFGHCVLLT